MAYDEDLADRGRAMLPPGVAVTERHMFGGLPFLLGHMFCGVVKDTLMVRLGPEDADRVLDHPHVRPMDFTGRPMVSMVFVDPEGLRGDAERRQQISRTSSGPEVLVVAAVTWSGPRRRARSR